MDRGAKIIARALRDAGMEVIYTGLRQTPEMIVSAAHPGGRGLHRPVNSLGRAYCHRSAHPSATRRSQAEDILLVLGGTIPEQDAEAMRASGVAAIFGPGTPLETTVTFIREHAKPRGALAG